MSDIKHAILFLSKPDLARGNERAILNDCAGAHQQNTGAPPHGPLQMSSGQQWGKWICWAVPSRECVQMNATQQGENNKQAWLTRVTLALWHKSDFTSALALINAFKTQGRLYRWKHNFHALVQFWDFGPFCFFFFFARQVDQQVHYTHLDDCSEHLYK